ncbi:hypothetical protein [Clostridium perfringens]|uniref:hypothetical protein n=2 Tax=Clostridium perfringens TaxID=1502 RepID=UPI001A350591|nr:hypothetical protein [Clostridium perfringens]MDK0610398.1 hypothetical protein [Clostridium perfringens]MDM0758137.1 hypothetical protein [Clostridium perfringens]MDM0760080.1 hypothetical protein [Clostridium perfringens]MDM0995544.1 hypothetical protein [Clostridium perfringens]MDZ4948903.1 hypothetical protein [Clostridium perfringens]
MDINNVFKDTTIKKLNSLYPDIENIYDKLELCINFTFNNIDSNFKKIYTEDYCLLDNTNNNSNEFLLLLESYSISINFKKVDIFNFIKLRILDFCIKYSKFSKTEMLEYCSFKNSVLNKTKLYTYQYKIKKDVFYEEFVINCYDAKILNTIFGIFDNCNIDKLTVYNKDYLQEFLKYNYKFETCTPSFDWNSVKEKLINDFDLKKSIKLQEIYDNILLKTINTLNYFYYSGEFYDFENFYDSKEFTDSLNEAISSAWISSFESYRNDFLEEDYY